MSDRIGIGIVTYKRKDVLRETIRCVREYTARRDAEFVVADDGSTDGTLEMLRDLAVPVITGRNMGIAWNKNRALYYLAQARRCDVVILLEDDTQPNAPAWEQAWVEGTRRWGHANLAGPWLNQGFVRGTGTPEDPVLSRLATAQCASYSGDSLAYGGYYDPRFKGYGHEHVEHSRRLIRVGYGGTDDKVDGAEQVLFVLLNGAVTVQKPPSYFDKAQVERNLEVARHAMADRHYRAPWQSEDEMRQFRDEITAAL
ncbi:MAG: glycosyltransferase family 2 protein, partial [Acetobacteraceae bacterium]